MNKDYDFLTQLFNQSEIIENWFEEQWQKTSPPLYCSVDLRYSGFKLAPVDTNLFPAGFNLLPPETHATCVRAFREHFVSIGLEAPQNVLCIPENHTRNMGYLENLSVLVSLLEQAGFTVQMGTLMEEAKTPQEIQLPSGKILTQFPIQRTGNHLHLESFKPEFILLNHDLSGTIPALLENLDQTIIPPLKAGWSTRLKSNHFSHYQTVVQAFSSIVNIDPWQLFPLFHSCQEVDFKSHEGEDCIEKKAHVLFAKIHENYEKYHQSAPPFLIIKSDSGTYGMGVMTLRSPEEIHHLNRKERTRMSTGKGGVDIHRILIQEGIYTSEKEKEGEGAAEAVVYMIGKETVGGFYRLHADRKNDENLNAPGMYFDRNRFMALEKTNPVQFYAYRVVARLALLAAALELNEMKEVTP